MKNPPLPRERAPLITIALFDANSPNLAIRLKDIAAQDYAGPAQVLVIGNSETAEIRHRMNEFPWVQFLDQTAQKSNAFSCIAGAAQGEWIAILPSTVRPDSRWLGELVSIALAHPDAFAVVPTAAGGQSGTLVTGLARIQGLGWKPSETPATQAIETEREVEAMMAAGPLIHAGHLRQLLPVDAELDFTGGAIDLSLRARAKGWPLFVAPRARVRISRWGRSNSSIYPEAKSELFLLARHDARAIPETFVKLKIAKELDESALEALLLEVFQRAGLELHPTTAEMFARVVVSTFNEYKSVENKLESCEESIRVLEKEKHEVSVVMHREMAWAHTLNLRFQEADDRAKRVTTDAEQRFKGLQDELEQVTEELTEKSMRLDATERELTLLREQKQGVAMSEARAAELERRWREADDKRESALRDLGVAQERARNLEEARVKNERLIGEYASAKTALEVAIRNHEERYRNAELNLNQAEIRLVERKAAHEEIVQRLKQAQEGFDAASRALHQIQIEREQHLAQIHELETRKKDLELMENSLRAELDIAQKSLANLTGELGSTRRKLGEEAQRTGKEMERATSLINALEEEVKTLTERKTAAEKTSQELRSQLEKETSQVRQFEEKNRQLTLQIKELQSQLGESRRAFEATSDERNRFAEALSQLQQEFNELELLQESTAQERDQLREQLKRDTEEFREQRKSLKAAISEYENTIRTERDTIQKLQGDLAKSNKENAALRENVASLNQQLDAARKLISQLEADLQATRAELANTKAELQQTREKLQLERDSNANLRQEIAQLNETLRVERTHSHSLHLRNLELDRQLALTQQSLEETRVRLDETLSQLEQRASDLAQLRQRTIAERDALVAQIVSLLEEVRRPRWRGRRLSLSETELLTGAGAGFLTKTPRT